MRRWIVILLMFVLPLQLGWAAAASLCQDEAGAQAPHFGHHLHDDAQGLSVVSDASDAANTAEGAEVTESPHGVDAPEASDAPPPAADHDCGCSGQLCGVHLLPTGLSGMPCLALDRCTAWAQPGDHRSCDVHRIERPNWPTSP